MKKSIESRISPSTEVAALTGILAVALTGILAAPAEATQNSEYISPTERVILSAADRLDQIIANPETAVSVVKMSGNRIKITANTDDTTITKIDGQYVDTYTATKQLADGGKIFETILNDSTREDSAYFFVLGHQNPEGKTTRIFTYNNGSYEEKEAQIASKDVIGN